MHIKITALDAFLLKLRNREVLLAVATWTCVGALCLFLANVLVTGT